MYRCFAKDCVSGNKEIVEVFVQVAVGCRILGRSRRQRKLRIGIRNLRKDEFV